MDVVWTDHNQRHVENMDPVKRNENGWKPRHLLWLLLWNFRWEQSIASELHFLSSECTALIKSGLMCVFAAVSELSGSVAINQVLK